MSAWKQRTKFKGPTTGIHGVIADCPEKIFIHHGERSGIVGWDP
jgi:hypothetical protein